MHKSTSLIVLDTHSFKELLKASHEELLAQLEKFQKAPSKEYLTQQELMELTGWSKRYLQDMRSHRELAFIQVGRKILYKFEDVQAYLESFRVAAKKKW